jgi:hypothetical protein
MLTANKWLNGGGKIKWDIFIKVNKEGILDNLENEKVDKYSINNSNIDWDKMSDEMLYKIHRKSIEKFAAKLKEWIGDPEFYVEMVEEKLYLLNEIRVSIVWQI